MFVNIIYVYIQYVNMYDRIRFQERLMNSLYLYLFIVCKAPCLIQWKPYIYIIEVVNPMMKHPNIAMIGKHHPRCRWQVGSLQSPLVLQDDEPRL